MSSLKATHTVANGRLKHNAYIDGQTARDIATGRVLAVQSKEGKWSKPVREIVYKASQFDHVQSLGNPAITMQFDTKGKYH